MDQPTTRRVQASKTTARNNNPAQVVKQFAIEVDGGVKTSTRSRISVIYDTLTGKEKSRIILSSNDDYEGAFLQARNWGPWETPSGLRVRLERDNLVAYDRDNYDIVSRADISELLGQYGSVYGVAFDDGRRIAMIVEVERQIGTGHEDDGFGDALEWGAYKNYSHVVAFDFQSGELLFKTPLGTEIQSDYCTNIQVAYD